MKLTQTAEYALRVMAIIASLEPGKPVRAIDLTDKTGIPPHYLSKIMRRLVAAGLLKSQKGRGGGFVLARPLSEIFFSDILKAVNYNTEAAVCVFGWEECSEENPCPLHFFWRDVKNYFSQWAEKHTLKEVKEVLPQISSQQA